MTKEVVIIGGSYAGQLAAKHILSKGITDLRVTVISKATTCFFTVAAPRLLVEPENMDRALFGIEDSLKKVKSKSQLGFIHGSVTQVDFLRKTVEVERNSKTQSLPYDILVIASGTSYESPLFKLRGGHESTVDEIKKTSEDIKTASKIAVVGGGPTGVETAGEIGYQYGKLKSVTLITGSTGPLAYLGEHRSLQALKKLHDVGVLVVNSKRAEMKTPHVLVYSDGKTENFDLIIKANGLKPNSNYLPTEVLDASGFVVTNEFLQLEEYPDVVAAGDIVANTPSDLVTLSYVQSVTLKRTLDFLIDQTADKRTPLKAIRTTQLVPISREGGIGVAFGFGIPNFLVRFFKAKDFMINKAADSF